MKTCTSLLVVLFVSVFPCFGQGENNIWCFGARIGLDFNVTPPAMYPNEMAAVEGCTTVCDETGGLLFYAIPSKIWNRNHVVMPNSNGLIGGTSATDGVVAVRSFSNPNQYYLFMMQEYQNGTSNLYYSVVDMTLDGGLGDIVPSQKNILLDNNTIEKMTVAKGSGCSSWLLVHAEMAPEFHAFKIDYSGLNTVPVISNSGNNNNYAIGQMKASPGNNMIALCSQLQPFVELHSFNNVTGVVSNGATLETTINLFDDWYGVDFSPDGSKLYAATFYGVKALYQYDLSAWPNIAAIQATRYLVASDAFAGIRLGPDNKLYITSLSAGISVVNNPNIAGAGCNFSSFMPSIWARLGLGSTFVVNQPSTVKTAHDTTFCFGLNSLTLSAPAGFTSYLWDDNSTLQTHVFSGAGTRWVTSVNGCATQTDTFHINAGTIDTTKTSFDTSICFAVNAAVLSAPSGYDHYLWNDNTTLQTKTFTGPGTKWVYMQTGCDMVIDTFHVTAHLDTTKLSTDTFGCFVNNYLIITAPGGYTSYVWSDGKTTQSDTFSTPGIKWVMAQNGCALLIDTFHMSAHFDTIKTWRDTSHCVAYSPITIHAPAGYTSYLWNDGKATQADTFFSTVTKWVVAQNGCNIRIDTVHFTATTIPPDSLHMTGIDTTICFESGPVNVSAPNGYTYYLWNDGINTQNGVFNGPGIKWVYAQKLCELVIDTFKVHAQGTDTITGRIDTAICFSSMATLAAMSGYDTYMWSDGSTGQTDTFSTTSIKRVNAHKACMERIDTFDVQFINDLGVDIGEDTALCKGESIQLDATNGIYANATYLWQDGKTNPIYNVTEGGDYTVKVSVGPCSVSDTVRVHQKVIDIKLGKGLIPCRADFVLLDAGVANARYLWQDGSTQRIYKATKEGTYSVKVTQDNCSATASVQVKYEGCPCHVVIPTGFSPNNDSRNDKFGATISCDIQSYKLLVYNRWGNQVFYSEDVNSKWDGTCKGMPVDGDVFNYYIEFKDAEGQNYYYKGDVTLVR